MNNRGFFAYAALLLCGSSIDASRAQQLSADQSELESVYVIGIPSTQDNPELPPAAIVIRREQLARFGSASLAAVLAQLPSIAINQNGGRGSFNSLFLRGADPNFTQVRIDGVAVNDATNTRGGAFDISSINAQIIERIEIIADASSAVYGSQTLAGIINIVTRSASLESAVEFDSHGGETAAVFLAGDDLTLSLVHERPGSIIDGSVYQSDEIGVKFKRKWADHQLQLLGRVQQYQAEAYPDDSGGHLFSRNRETERRSGDVLQLALHYNYLTDNHNWLEFNASFYQQQEQRLTPAVLPGVRDPFGLPQINSDTGYQRTQAELRFINPINDALLLRSAFSWEQEDGQQQGELDFSFFQLATDFDLRRSTLAVSQTVEVDLSDNAQIIIAGRLDETDDDTIFSPRVSLSYNFDEKKQLLYATLGEGFKQASMYALADPVIGNQDLLDETAESLQLGHRYLGDSWQIKHNAYYYSFSNLIDFDAGPPPSLVNRDSVKVTGLESIFSYQQNSEAPRSWQIDFFQSYTSTEVVGTDIRLRNRPRYRAGLKINYMAREGLNLWLRTRYTGNQLDSSIPTGDVVLPDYGVSDFGFAWQFAKRWHLNAQWKNMFSKNYSESIGNPVTGDTILLQFTYQGPKLF